MSLILQANLKISDLPEDKIHKGKKGEYIPVTIIVNETLNDFDKQGPVYVQQTKEERELQTKKHYLGDVVVLYNDLKEISTTKILLDE